MSTPSPFSSMASNSSLAEAASSMLARLMNPCSLTPLYPFRFRLMDTQQQVTRNKGEAEAPSGLNPA
eukprot:CAMPEP_0171956900 /NCGR_PEP_ID=MMETSP0993-20121228/126857_1 /TAXON_ID=483369 /ORGANISM="non described non described, Strain CCMP2098" /LENGTH=66 /DNA_ID=CAMNT_0012603643 /DNA_START=29 /DNA_END=225 /DNA_ORIENTATION=+